MQRLCLYFFALVEFNMTKIVSFVFSKFTKNYNGQKVVIACHQSAMFVGHRRCKSGDMFLL